MSIRRVVELLRFLLFVIKVARNDGLLAIDIA
ncbi:MAG: hypothetical protein N838_34500 [Thiohalocapsa sp. PB-PSB1]|nr:MAG: hypothetical protein N838_34500 [Thiohalocapsa sp. PB-PSB1]